MNMISGYLPPSGGIIALNGETISGLPANRIGLKGVARTFQLVRVLPSLTVAENVITALAFGKRRLWGAPARNEAMQRLDEVGLANRADDKASDLTYIDQKRMEIARAMACEPQLLLLDEWLAGLNPTELKDGIALVRSIAGKGTTVLLVEHVMEAVRQLCSRCIVMNAGRKIADGTTASVLSEPEVIKAYLGDAHA
jgi:branched-chain amino acid transport system ATP-binding protein